MSRAVLRSIAAILLGWLVTVGGYVITMIVIALFDSEAFQPGVHHSFGYWLLTLSVDLIYSVVGGFVTGIIAGRRELAHAIGLVVFGLLIWECLPGGHADTTSTPNWYWIAGYILMPSATILGGWLRAKQDVLATRIPQKVVTPIDNLRLSVSLMVEFYRFPIAVVASVVTFVISLYAGMFSAGAVLLAVRKLSGEEPEGDVAAALISLALVLSLLLASVLSRRVFRRIMPRDTSSLKDGRRE